MRSFVRNAVVILVLAALIVLTTVYIYRTEGSRHGTEDYVLWSVYLLLLLVIAVFMLEPLNSALNVITGRVPPRI